MLLIVFACVVVAVLWLAFTQRHALSSFGGFLFSPTGWDISLTFIPYSANDPYWWAFLVGLTNTVMAGAFGIIGATLIGFVIGAAPLANNKILSMLASVYTDVFRNIPLILQAIFWYGIILHLPPARQAIRIFDAVFLSSRGFVVPKFSNTPLVLTAVILAALCLGFMLKGFRIWRDEVASPRQRRRVAIAALVAVSCAAGLLFLAPSLAVAAAIDWPVLQGLNFRGGLYMTPEFAAVVVAIVIYRGAFMAEIFRGGFTSTSPGQIDAAKSLGLRPLATLWKVRLPIALVHIVPPLSNEYINIVKVTAIGIIIGFPDLFWVSSNATMQTGKPMQVLFVMIAIYLVLNFSLAAVMNAINDRVRARGFS
ncbi:MAG: ABC transporter permease subunit [Variibacter sp.]